MSKCEKFSISLSAETLAQMEFLREHLGLHPGIKRSQLVAQIIFECFAIYQAEDIVDDKPSSFIVDDYFA